MKDGFYIFETYSIVSQKEEFKISKTDISEILYRNTLYILILKYNGTNGIMSKKLALNTEPWSDLNSEISRIKKTIFNNV
ncbi:hypothetical protein AEQU1_02321 [Aequorivita sp. CIP111184]|nr:hypothetical protein AEQU1_02321 [Aequorivita sp. CIP111184]